MKGWRLIAFAVLAAVLAVPGSAGAATITAPSSQVSYTALAGETNNLNISRDGADYVFTELGGVPITPALPCVNAGANVARCPAAPIRSMNVTLNDGSDFLTVAPAIASPQISSINGSGGDGVDTLTGGAAVRNAFQGGLGGDILTGGSRDDDFSGGEGADSLDAGSGNDFLRASADSDPDAYAGGPGNDDIFPDASGPDGADSYSGGSGFDRVDLRFRLDDLTISVNGAADDGATCPGAGCEGDNFKGDIEQFDLGAGDDGFVGGAGAQWVDGGTGSDDIDGGVGDDALSGSEDDDLVRGGGGNDFVTGANGSDLVNGGAGDDYIELFELFDGFKDTLGGGPGFDQTDGGNETIYSLRIDLDGRADDGPRESIFDGLRDNVTATIEGLEGTERADILIGNKRSNELRGGGGADRLIGKGGADGLDGGGGADRIDAGKGRDSILAGSGPDRIRSRDKSPDEVSCGSAGDLVTADRRDRVGADCDRVKRGRR
jgi:Ca2+-binding RTX toxin-like protein